MPDFDASKPTWNLAQLFVWVIARDEAVVAKYSDQSGDVARASLFSTLVSSDIAPDFARASRFVLRALLAGRLSAQGLELGKGMEKNVPSSQWAYLEFAPSEEGVYARPMGDANGRATEWHCLKFMADCAVALWPVRVKKQNRSEYEALMTLSRGESLGRHSGLRRQREFGTIKPLSLTGLSHDGLPDDPDSTATEALGWMTLGVAIPPSVWKLFGTRRDRLSDFRMARYGLSLAWGRFRDAHRSFLVELLDPDPLPDAPFSSSDAAIGNQVAATYFLEERERLGTVYGRYFEAASAESLVFSHVASASGLSDRESGWAWTVNRIQDTERLLFKVIREGALVLRGRRSTASLEWEIIPADHLRLPVQLNMDRNSLEPSGDGSMEDYKAVREGMPEWMDLQFRTSELRANADRLGCRRETGVSGAGNPMQMGTARGETLCREWLTELMKKEDRPTRLKEAIRDDGRAKFQISKRAFDRAWARAIEDSGNMNWSQSGPRSSKR